MSASPTRRPRRPAEGRFAEVSAAKASGATYTPPALASLLATELVALAAPPRARRSARPLQLLDPAIGDGALMLALLGALRARTRAPLVVTGYETDPRAGAEAQRAILTAFPDVAVDIRARDFLLDPGAERFDLAIANPPYVRTQILGAAGSRALAAEFGLRGRVDLYQAFALALVDHLAPGGALALITSNRFLTTKGAATFRDALLARLELAHLWDLGDTKLFDAAVLPAMFVGQRRAPGAPARAARFTSIYERAPDAAAPEVSLVDALAHEGRVRIAGRSVEVRTFEVRQGALRAEPGAVWRLSSAKVDGWLDTVRAHTWKRLGELGKVRVGVKTTADGVFIRTDWASFGARRPELLRPLITHHVARRYRAEAATREILYPHLDVDGRRTVAPLSRHPRSAAYLAAHRAKLEGRRYLVAAGRRWYELWVPHEPRLWQRPKLVFRDIAEQPTFWIDTSGSVVNGDCYWMVTDDPRDEAQLWLAVAVTNSTFIEHFYDRSFNNKLYAGRRRFMSQYVEQFPLPDPGSAHAKALVALAKRRHRTRDEARARALEGEIDQLVWAAFGLTAP